MRQYFVIHKNVRFCENKLFDHFTSIGIEFVHTLSDIVVDTLSIGVFSIKNLLTVSLRIVFLYFVIIKTCRDQIMQIMFLTLFVLTYLLDFISDK